MHADDDRPLDSQDAAKSPDNSAISATNSITLNKSKDKHSRPKRKRERYMTENQVVSGRQFLL